MLRAILAVLGLGLSIVATGCWRSSEGVRPTVPVIDVDVAFVPRAGMRLAYRVTNVYRLSGDAVKDTPPEQRLRSGAHQKVMVVTALGDRTFDGRITEGNQTFPATLRFARDWTLQRVFPDEPSKLSEAEWAALKGLPELFRVQSHYYRRWRLGEVVPWRLALRGQGGGTESMTGTIRLFGLVLVNGRPAAHFHAYAKGRAGDNVIETEGESWVDLATGVLLRSRNKTTQHFSIGGALARADIEQEEILDMGESKGNLGGRNE